MNALAEKVQSRSLETRNTLDNPLRNLASVANPSPRFRMSPKHRILLHRDWVYPKSQKEPLRSLTIALQRPQHPKTECRLHV